MNIPAEASKVAISTVDALKSTPIVLALVIFNILFIGFLGWVAIKQSERWDREIERWIEQVKFCQSSKTSP